MIQVLQVNFGVGRLQKTKVNARLHSFALAMSNQGLDAVEVLLIHRDHDLVHYVVVQDFGNAIETHERVLVLQTLWRRRARIAGMNEANQAQPQVFGALHKLTELKGFGTGANDQHIVIATQHAAQRALAIEEKEPAGDEQHQVQSPENRHQTAAGAGVEEVESGVGENHAGCNQARLIANNLQGI